jgi:hypothetical protein
MGGASEKVQIELAQSAIAKMRAGKTPTRQEAAALKRVEREREEAARWDFYRTIPKKHWRMMSGRQEKVLNEQAERYGLPIGGAVIDLTSFVKRFHDFLAENARKLAMATGADSEGESPSLERKRAADAQMAEMRVAAARGELVKISEIADGLGIGAAKLREAIERLEKKFGREAANIMVEALDDAERVWRETAGVTHEVDGQTNIADATAGVAERQAQTASANAAIRRG